VDINRFSGGGGALALILSSDRPVVAERSLYFGAGVGSARAGMTVAAGIITPATRLQLLLPAPGGLASDGTSQPVGNQEFLALLNPAVTGGTADVTARFTDRDGRVLGRPITVGLAPGRRQTIFANAVLGVGHTGPVVVSLSATLPIEAEASQYLGGSPNSGRHPGMTFTAQPGVVAAARLAGLATKLVDGTTVAGQLFLANPGAAPMHVAVTYFGATGATEQRRYSVPAGGIATANVRQDAGPAIPAGPVGAVLALAGGGGFLVSENTL
jgi:hypothetical protein